MTNIPDFLYRTDITEEKTAIHDYIREYFIPAFEEFFSYLAWKNFKQDGRGYLFVPIFEGKTPADGFQVLYFPKDSEQYKFARESEMKSGQQLEYSALYSYVCDYNPRYEYLILIGWNQDSGKATEHYFRRVPEKAPYLAKGNRK